MSVFSLFGWEFRTNICICFYLYYMLWSFYEIKSRLSYLMLLESRPTSLLLCTSKLYCIAYLLILPYINRNIWAYMFIRNFIGNTNLQKKAELGIFKKHFSLNTFKKLQFKIHSLFSAMDFQWVCTWSRYLFFSIKSLVLKYYTPVLLISSFC